MHIVLLKVQQHSSILIRSFQELQGMTTTLQDTSSIEQPKMCK